MNKDAKYFNAFNLIEGIGPLNFHKLLAYFPSLKEAWLANVSEFEKAYLKKALIKKIIAERLKIDPDLEMEKLGKEDISVITILDKDYPRLLKEIYRPPALLYLKGKIIKSDELALGVVGTRQPSFYGKQVTPVIAKELAQLGFTIVSGLARGIDTLAHKAALSAGGRTIAVLGSSIDKKNIYPSVNCLLAEQISKQGAIISEFPLNTIPYASNFPQRNRIISGLSLGTLVIEAPEKSGALLTARDALEQNREVFAVPGPIFSTNSFGPNNLIKMGAKLVSDASDILEELNISAPENKIAKKEIIPDNSEEASILEALCYEPVHIDKIIKQTKLTTAQVNSALILMEINGKVKNMGGGNYIIAR